ncbi:glycosyltransferase [Methanohalophilus halophilus]|uniref:Glycosyl transferase family 2 n=1 Tax=Methanohalophilus halophilus TaxID=2177 RepID=A0A1L3Q0Z0_9EURY|nr:glycosyltransferase [Methanohalophilus halophilus]APH38530.1 glycosyl transferase family 2 [Methanohalophilus halophilus]RNI08475.1 glycosyltransferase [Methanohalophilus halophilus]SDW12703.1 Glycosyltransferase, catalytic subunit of cellulose synthase and poly-beta-1,6-N-acetylglucosamine synthase [Methanohalophilus halophilus]
MNSLLIAAVLFTLIPLITYLIYILAILKPSNSKIHAPDTQPPITVVIPTYNESEVIEHRIKNLKDIDYPTENIHAIIVDDQSTDNTVELANKAFQKYSISGEVIVKEKRTGTNASVNLGVGKASTDFVVTTDADVTFEPDAVNNALGRLLSDEKIGAVCGELEPIARKDSFTTHSEKAYRDVYGRMCSWESGLHSTYCFNGPLIMLRKKAFSPIPETKGASDAGMALRIIRNGYRCLYESSARFYEYITSDMDQQRRQKLRRSARLQEATLHNLGLVSPKYGKFGLFVLPLRFVMFFIAPVSFFLAVVLWSIVLGNINLLWGTGVWILFGLALLSGQWRSNLISSFIWHQIYLLVSLVYMFKGVHIWQAIERKKV